MAGLGPASAGVLETEGSAGGTPARAPRHRQQVRNADTLLVAGGRVTASKVEIIDLGQARAATLRITLTVLLWTSYA